VSQRAAFDPAAALAAARQAGAEQTEAYYDEQRRCAISIKDGEVESHTEAYERGLAVRTITGRRLGFAYTSILDDQGVRAAARQALDNAAITPTDDNYGLAVPSNDYPRLELVDPALFDTPSREKVELMKDLERLAHKASPLIDSVPEARYRDVHSTVRVRNTNGVDAGYSTGVFIVELTVILRQGEEMQNGSSFGYGRSLDAFDADELVRDAVSEAEALLGGRPRASTQAPVILAPLAAAMILMQLEKALMADAVQRGRSLYADRLGDMVASPLVTLVDDPTDASGSKAAPCDGEGTACARLELISQGRLCHFLHSVYTAAREGRRSSGNARRGSYRHQPDVRGSNLYITAGETDPEAIIADVDAGLYVMDIIGSTTGGINHISGDISLGVAGRWIRNGRLAEPVREMTIAGNIIGILKSVQAVGSDLKFLPLGGHYGAPTLKIANLPISGR